MLRKCVRSRSSSPKPAGELTALLTKTLIAVFDREERERMSEWEGRKEGNRRGKGKGAW